MHIADMTMFYAPASGGVRTYLDAKHHRLDCYSGVRHSLLIPGARLSNADGIYKVPAPALPFGNGYRFPLRMAPWRNVIRNLQPELLDCMKRLGRAYHLLLVGSHMPAAVPDNVSVIDHFCPPHEVARLLASADALVHAGDQETFGLVVLEAMASGTPVVAVAAGAFTEILPTTCGILCKPNHPGTMAAAVSQLFSHDVARTGAAARSHVEDNYAWDTVVSGLLGHYRAVLDAPMPALAHG